MASDLIDLPPYFNINPGSKLFVCATPQPTDLDASGFPGLTYVLVGGVGNIWGTLAGAGMIGGLQKIIEFFNPSNTLAAQTYMITGPFHTKADFQLW